ncbi:pentatricopeptide repeat-containing protein At5g39680 [Durio zibethinus]|uniref:Pentatricopeptide repeat-containing protein At5g39680 n=1 Tax=Durio zibethinus TaxID=66656 RepID=A0A6P6BBL6_DURZI|nr:pentatricopeptide repeat-containing protein At5g39680 [Durio zibethinus]
MPGLKRPRTQLVPFLFNPTNSMLLSHIPKLLKVSADTKNLRLGKIIHTHLLVTNQISVGTNINPLNSLINLYAKCNQISIAQKVFERMQERNLVSWCSLMAGYLQTGFSLEVLKLFKNMTLVDSLRPNEYIFAVVFSACSDSGKALEGRQCHGYVFKSGLVFYQYVKNALINMYSKFVDVEGAMRVFSLVPGYDVFTYNSVLSGLLEQGFLNEGVEILERMMGESVEWDSVTYVTVFGLCACLKDLKLGLQLHSRILKSDVKLDVFVNSAIINMYGKCGEVFNARKAFDGLLVRNVVVWTGIMAAYSQNGCFEEALNLFPEMKLDDISPNEFTFGVMLNSTSGLSALKHGDVLYGEIVKSGFKDHVIVGNALINMYAKCGNIEAASKVFSDMMYRDSITWNVMICGYSHHGLGKEAMDVFQDMLDVGQCPNYITFVGVLSACSHLGLVKEGLSYLNQFMRQVGVEPGLEHYTCVVGLLSKAGLLNEAEKFLRSIPVKWDVVAWRTLLSACRVHRNYGFGRRIAEFVLEMDPNDVGTYTLLSNVYAKAKRWDEVVKIRKLMRDRNIKKEPGVSWIEVRNITHVFVSEDCQHPESSQIHEKVKELLARIKPLGYIPDVAAVLHDVEEEQKEDYLSYHSEKLAIAYGLMQTPFEAPIRVFKNLRMCDDCHSAVKLISKVTNRIIIVRDANRFHSFQNGCCSCADYW